GKQFQFKPVVMLFTGTSRLMFPRSLMHRSRKSCIAPTAASAPGNHQVLIRAGKIEHPLACRLVIHNRSHRNFQNDIFAFAAALVRAFTVTPALRFVFGIETEVHQRIVTLAGFHDHISAVAPVAPGWAAAWNILFAAKGHTAVAAVAGLHSNSRLIDEHDSTNPRSN